jgi:hypothetical protein
MWPGQHDFDADLREVVQKLAQQAQLKKWLTQGRNASAQEQRISMLFCLHMEIRLFVDVIFLKILHR